jgi:hypothetical protein
VPAQVRLVGASDPAEERAALAEQYPSATVE